MTKEDLEQIREVMREEVRVVVKEEVRNAIKEEVRAIVKEEVKIAVKEELKPVNERLDRIEGQLEEIKEDAAITRVAVNELGKWAEIISDRLDVPYPVE